MPMPNRILRDWTASDKMDRLSIGGEIFFTRLIMKADDYGLFYGNPKLLNSALFPLKDYDNSKISGWLNECVNAEVIKKYSVKGKDYIQIIGFDQRLRLMKSKFPDPDKLDEFTEPSHDSHLSDNGRPETKGNESETEEETETKGADSSALLVWPSFDDFWDKYDKKTDRSKCEKKFKKIDQGAREKIMQHLDLYVMGTPDKQYRKDPATYLNNKSWENEVVFKAPTNGQRKGLTAEGTIARRNSYTND